MTRNFGESVTILSSKEGIFTIDEDGCVWFHGRKCSYPCLERINTTLYKVNIPNVQIKTMSASPRHWVGIDSLGKVWGFGNNSNQELGVNSRSVSFLEPVHIPIREEIVSVTCHYARTFFLSAHGKVYACGFNGLNKLGIPHGMIFDKKIVKTPTLIPKLKDIVHIECNSDNSIFLTESGDLYVCGTVCNPDSTNQYDTFPVIARKSRISNVKNIVCGYFHTMIQTNNDEIFIFGNTHILKEQHNPISIDITSSVQSIYSVDNGVVLESNNTLWATKFHSTLRNELYDDGFKLKNLQEFVKIEPPPGIIVDCILSRKSILVITSEGIYQIGSSISSQHKVQDIFYEWNCITEEKKQYFNTSKYFRNIPKSAKSNINIRN